MDKLLAIQNVSKSTGLGMENSKKYIEALGEFLSSCDMAFGEGMGTKILVAVAEAAKSEIVLAKDEVRLIICRDWIDYDQVCDSCKGSGRLVARVKVNSKVRLKSAEALPDRWVDFFWNRTTITGRPCKVLAISEGLIALESSAPGEGFVPPIFKIAGKVEHPNNPYIDKIVDGKLECLGYGIWVHISEVEPVE